MSASFDHGVRAVSAAGGSRVPLALVILIFDSFRVAGDFLLLGRRLRGCERFVMGQEGFRKHGVDLIGPPAAVVLGDYCPLRCMTPAGGSHGNPYPRREFILTLGLHG
jgi:hypothetical protein